MTYWDRKLIREQLDERLGRIKSFADTAKNGWVKIMREALGMSAKQLGKRVGLDQSRITRLENAEIEGDLKLSSLKKIADGLDMEFVYYFVPRRSLEQMVYDQAKSIAKKRLTKVNQTMRLEDQELSDNQKAKALDDLIQKILINEPKDFWDI